MMLLFQNEFLQHSFHSLKYQYKCNIVSPLHMIRAFDSENRARMDVNYICTQETPNCEQIKLEALFPSLHKISRFCRGHIDLYRQYELRVGSKICRSCRKCSLMFMYDLPVRNSQYLYTMNLCNKSLGYSMTLFQ